MTPQHRATSPLPVLHTDGDLQVIDPSTGESLALRDASDHAIAHACERVTELDRALLETKRALAAEMRERHGVGTVHAGGYTMKVTESQSWPLNATESALHRLLSEGRISPGDVERCMPSKPRPDGRQLKALVGRLLASDPDAARVLAEACTTSPPSVRDIEREAVDAA